MIPITLLSADEFPLRGGLDLIITGTFVIGINYSVYIGPLGTSADEPCYSGISGQGYVVRSTNGITLEIITPPLDRGAVILSVYGGGDSGSYPGPYGYGYGYYGYGSTLLAVEDSFIDIQWQFITGWPADYDTPPRNLIIEPRQDL